MGPVCSTLSLGAGGGAKVVIWHLLTAIGQGFDGCQGLSDGAFPAAHNIDDRCVGG